MKQWLLGLFGLERPVFTFISLPPDPQSDAMTVELHRVCNPDEAHGMLEHVIELAKMGYSAESLRRIAHAAEHAEVLSFEYGKIRRISRGRSLRELLEDCP